MSIQRPMEFAAQIEVFFSRNHLYTSRSNLSFHLYPAKTWSRYKFSCSRWGVSFVICSCSNSLTIRTNFSVLTGDLAGGTMLLLVYYFLYRVSKFSFDQGFIWHNFCHLYLFIIYKCKFCNFTNYNCNLHFTIASYILLSLVPGEWKFKKKQLTLLFRY